MSVELTDMLVIGAAGIIILTWLISEISRVFSNKNDTLEDFYNNLD